MHWFGYFIGCVLLILALFVGRSSSRNVLRARDVSGNTIVGNVSGSVSQGTAPPIPQRSIPPTDRARAAPDRVAWGIAIIGALIALAQLAYDLQK